MTINGTAKAAREAARQKTGQFGHQIHAEAEVELGTPFERVRDFFDQNPAWGPRIDIEDDLTFDDDQDTNLYLLGIRDRLEEEYEDLIFEYQGLATQEAARDACKKLDLDFEKLSDREQSEIFEEAERHFHDSDVLDLMAYNASASMLEQTLIPEMGNAVYDLYAAESNPRQREIVVDGENCGASEEEVTAARVDALARILDHKGVIGAADLNDAGREALTELVEAGPATWGDSVQVKARWVSPLQVASLDHPGGVTTLDARDGILLEISEENTTTGTEEVFVPAAATLRLDSGHPASVAEDYLQDQYLEPWVTSSEKTQ